MNDQTPSTTKPDAHYGFLREPLSVRGGYTPDPHGGAVGTYTEVLIRAEFGDWDIETADDDEDLLALKVVHGLAETTWRGTIDTIEQLSADDDPTLNNDSRLKIVGGIVEPKLTRLAALAEQEFIKTAASLDRVQADITKTVRVADPIDIAVHHSIREHIKALGGSLSIAAVHQAINDRDVRTLQAIATAPPYLSGITGAGAPAVFAQVQTALAALMAPDLTQRAAALRSGMAKAAQALSALDRKVNKTLDLKKARALRERSKPYNTNA